MRIGIDILDVDRIEKACRNPRFLDRIFTENEKSYIAERRNSPRTIGGMFSAKEAASKMIGRGISGYEWKDIEILHMDNRKPVAVFHGKALEFLEEAKLTDVDLSISHSDKSITAVCAGLVKESRIQELPDSGIVLPKRKDESHKGSYGRVAVIGGSTGMSGAPCMSSFSALRTGSGLVYTLVPKAISDVVSIKSLESIVVPVDDQGRGHFTENSYNSMSENLDRMDVLAIGPGMSSEAGVLEFVKRLVSRDCPKVIDADGINALSREKSLLTGISNAVLTPHLAEFSRLIGKDLAEVEQDKAKWAREFVAEYDVVLVLKGHHTLVIDKDNEYVNTTGNPGMATAGSGDVLTGIIASLIGQGLGLFEASKTGVYLHGLAGDLAAEDKGEYGMIARDVISKIPYAAKIIVSER